MFVLHNARVLLVCMQAKAILRDWRQVAAVKKGLHAQSAHVQRRLMSLRASQVTHCSPIQPRLMILCCSEQSVLSNRHPESDGLAMIQGSFPNRTF